MTTGVEFGLRGCPSGAVRLGLAPGARWSGGEQEALALVRGSRVAEVGRPCRSVRLALARLTSPSTLETLKETIETEAPGSASAMAELYLFLDRLAQEGDLVWVIGSSEAPLAVMERRARGPESYVRWREEGTSRLSRFAYMRSEDGRLLLESPLSFFRFTVGAPSASAILYELSRGAHTGQLASLPGAGSPGNIEAFVALLGRSGFLVRADEEEASGGTAHWEFHDLLFHARSREGRHGEPTGYGPRENGFGTSTPAVPAPRGEAVALPRPNLQELIQGDKSFSWVIENRKSVHSYSEAPLDVNRLGEFLFRSCRLRGLRAGPHGEVCDRPYPSAGARHPLEIYPVVRTCDGLEPGFYHYACDRHELERIRGLDDEVRELLNRSVPDHDADGTPPVLFVLAARFARTASVYRSIAYALILKDVGVLMQTMYLVATAMGLPCCAVGNGDSEIFSRCLGVLWGTETSVGEIVLGAGAATSEVTSSC